MHRNHYLKLVSSFPAHPCRVGAAPHDHRPNHQWDRDPDPDPRRQGHQPAADERVQILFQPLWPGNALHQFTPLQPFQWLHLKVSNSRLPIHPAPPPPPISPLVKKLWPENSWKRTAWQLLEANFSISASAVHGWSLQSCTVRARAGCRQVRQGILC